MTLIAIAREVYAESGQPDRYKLIDAIMTRIAPSEREEYLRDAIRMLTPTLSASFRNAAIKTPVRSGRTEGTEDYSGQVEVGPEGTGEKRVVISHRRDGIREWAQNLTKETIPGVNGVIFIGEGTAAGFRKAASARRSGGSVTP